MIDLRKCFLVGGLVAFVVLCAHAAFGQVTVDDQAFTIHVGNTWSTTYPPGAYNMTERVCAVVAPPNTNHDIYHAATVTPGTYSVYFRWEVWGGTRRTQWTVFDNWPSGPSRGNGDVQQTASTPADKVVGGKNYKKLGDFQISSGTLTLFLGNMRDGVTHAAVDAYYYEPLSVPTPAPVSATPDGGTVNVTWSPTSPLPSDYTVALMQGATVIQSAVKAAGTTSHSFTGVLAGTYFVRVTPNGPGLSSADSTAFDVVLPTAPNPVTASASGRNIAVNWAAVSGATGYRVALRTATPAGEVTVYDNVPGTSTAFTSVADGQYFVRVTANGAADETGDSGSVTIGDTDGAPSPVYGSAVGNTITVTWRAVSGATGYQVYVHKAATREVWRVATNVTNSPATFTDAPPGQYYAAVHALSPATGSGESAAFAVGSGSSGAPWGEAPPSPGNYGPHVYDAGSVKIEPLPYDRVRARLMRYRRVGYQTAFDNLTRFDSAGQVEFIVQVQYRVQSVWTYYRQYKVTVGRNGFIGLSQPQQVIYNDDASYLDPAFVDALLAGPGGLAVEDGGGGCVTNPATDVLWKQQFGIKDLATAVAWFQSLRSSLTEKGDFRSLIPRTADQTFDGEGGGGGGSIEFGSPGSDYDLTADRDGDGVPDYRDLDPDNPSIGPYAKQTDVLSSVRNHLPTANLGINGEELGVRAATMHLQFAIPGISAGQSQFDLSSLPDDSTPWGQALDALRLLARGFCLLMALVQATWSIYLVLRQW